MTDPSLVPADVVRTIPEGEVVFGMQLPIQSQSTLYVADWERDAGPTELARIARVADESGFFYLGVCDHTAIPRRLAEAMGTIWYDTTATLGWLAALTSRTHLLSHVLILAQRHPLRAAKELSTLDHLSGGRLIVGVGAGHVPEEYELLTGDFEGRGRHTDEAVSALARCFTAEFPDLPGPRFPARDMGLGPRPARQPRPPSGSAVPPRRPSGVRRPSATDGFPRARGDATCRARSPGCASCEPSCAATRRSTSAPSSSRSTWAPVRGGTSPTGSSPVTPSRWPSRCASWWAWASTTCRCASWREAPRSSASRRRASASRWGPC